MLPIQRTVLCKDFFHNIYEIFKKNKHTFYVVQFNDQQCCITIEYIVLAAAVNTCLCYNVLLG